MSDRNKEVLKLAAEIYSRSKAYQALDEILDLIEGSGLFSAEELKRFNKKQKMAC